MPDTRLHRSTAVLATFTAIAGAVATSVLPIGAAHAATASTIPNPTPAAAHGAVPPSKKAASANQQFSPLPTTSTTAPTKATTPATDRIVDDFSKPLDWALWADAEGLVGITAYEDNPAAGFELPANWSLITWLRDRSYADADITTSVTIAKKPEDYSVGVFCRGQGKARYEFHAGNFGTYAIWKADANGKWTNITPGGKWVASEAIPKGFDELQISARCRGDKLTMLVGGKELVTVTDKSITGAGSVGLVTSNYDKASTMRAFFDDVEVKL